MQINFEDSVQSIDPVLFLNKLGQELVKQILENIKQGVNNNGEKLARYSQSSDRVDFKVTGRMLSQLTYKIEKGNLVIFVNGDRAEIADKINKSKNWQFLEWGKTLDEVFERVLNETITEAIQ